MAESINTSGGNLAIDKCVIVFFLYKTNFDKGKSMVVLKQIIEGPGNISLQPFDQEATRTDICRIEASYGA